MPVFRDQKGGWVGRVNAKKLSGVTIPYDARTPEYRAQLLGITGQIAGAATTLMKSLSSEAVTGRLAANDAATPEREQEQAP